MTDTCQHEIHGRSTPGQAGRSWVRGCLSGLALLALVLPLGLIGSLVADDQNAQSLVHRIDGSLPRAKISSILRHYLEQPAGTPIDAQFLRTLAGTSHTGVLLPVRLDVVVTDANIAAISAIGVVVRSTSAQWNTVRVDATLAQIDALALLPQVKLIAPVRRPHHHSQPGTYTNQAAAIIKTPQVQATYNVTGAGFSVGIISDSINETSEVGSGTLTGTVGDQTLTNTIPQNAGNLPASITVIDVGNADDFATDTDEGEAMMEEAYHLAPGASFFFAACDDLDTEMAGNIQKLTAAGCKIVCDDVGFNDEPMFQDGPIAQAANAVVAAGGIYLSAAGNSADSGILQTYTAVSPGSPDPHSGGLPNGNNFQNWGIGGATPGFLPFTVTPSSGGGASISVVLEWNQPYASWSLGAGSQSDYDLYVYKGANVGAVQAGASLNNQGNTGAPSGDPFEVTSFDTDSGAPETFYLAVDRYQGISTGTVIRVVVSVEGGTVTSPYYSTVFGAGTCYGHPAAASVLAIAASPYTAPTTVESFTSKGGWGSNGLPFYYDTSGNPLSGAPQLRNKPNITAPDGCTTSTASFAQFYGTSGATPHASAAATLVWAAQPTLTNAQVINALQSTATDITTAPASSGPDAWSGYGMVNALAAAGAYYTVVLSSSLGSSTTGLPVTVNATFPLPPSSFTLSDVTPSVGTLSNLSGSGSAYSFTWTPPAGSTGTATLVVPAGTVTESGSSTTNNVSNTLSLTFNTSPPATPVITSPVAAATVGANFTIAGTVTSGLTLTVKVNGSAVTPVIAGTSWTASATGVAAGSATITAVATNSFGTSSATASVTVTVNTTPPVLTFTAPTTPTNSTVLTLTGTVSATATMSITDGTTVLGTPTLSASGTAGIDNWTFTTAALSNGTHVLHAVAVNTLGTTASVSNTVVIDTTPPLLTLATPSALEVGGPSQPTSSVIAVSYSDAYPSAFTLTAGEVILSATGTATATLGVASNNITLSGCSGNGTLKVSIAAHAATDALGNLSVLTGPSLGIAVGTPPLTAVISSSTPGSPAVTASMAIAAVLTFSSPVTTTLLASDFSGTNCTVTPGTQTSSTSYSFTIVPNASVASFSVDYIGNTTVQDLSGDPWSGTTNTLSFTTATTPVGVVVSLPVTQGSTSTANSISFLATFSQTVTTLTNAQVIVGGTAGGTLVATVTNPSSDHMTYLVTVTGMAAPNGTVILTVPADQVTGQVGGQPNSASTGSGDMVIWAVATAGAAAPSSPGGGGGGGCGLGAGAAALILAYLAFMRTGLRDSRRSVQRDSRHNAQQR